MKLFHRKVVQEVLRGEKDHKKDAEVTDEERRRFRKWLVMALTDQGKTIR